MSTSDSSDVTATQDQDAAFTCPLTLMIMREPVVDPNGITYEKSAILKWLESSNTSPVTRQPLTASQLVPNRALKDLIQQKYPNLEPLPVTQQAFEILDTNVQVKGIVNNDKLVVEWQPPLQPNPSNQRAPTDLVCVIDVSGSMGAEALVPGSNESTGLTILDIVKHATRTIIASLNARDRLGIVTFTDDAQVVCELTPMTEQGKRDVQNKVEALRELSSTNIYDGLVKGLGVLKQGGSVGGSVLLLTDGVPNIEPPRGTLQGFVKHRDSYVGDTSFCKSISTFGFGYSLDSRLLHELARSWSSGGTFSFIPDAGMVGTVFVNSLANILSRVPVDLSLKVEGNGLKLLNALGLNGKETSWGWDISGGALEYGQSRQLIFSGATQGVTITASVKVGDVKKDVGVQLVQNDMEMAWLRNRFCEEMYKIMWLTQWYGQGLPEPNGVVGLPTGVSDDSLRQCTNWVEGLAGEISSSPAMTNPETRQIAQALLEDVQGQVKQAVSRKDWFLKWGCHYLPSLARAHLLQECNNFKDAGVQVYGGELFKQVRDRCDDIFIALPPPKPSSRVMPSGYPSFNAAPVSMARYYDANNPCFDGNSLVEMANGDLKRVMDLNKGDLVKGLSGNGRVECIVKTYCDASVGLLCKVGDLRVTPWHPIFHEGEWKFPCEIVPPKYSICEAVYSIVLQGESCLMVGGIPVVSLGHGLKDVPRFVSALGCNGEIVWKGFTNILSHDFFGDKIIGELEKTEGWTKGLIEFQHGCIKRDSVAIGLNMKRLVRVSNA